VTEDKKALFVRRLFSRVPAEYDWLLDILSLRQDRHWRDRLVQAADSSNGNLVLDVATGTGLVASRLAKKIGKATLSTKGQGRSTDWVLARAENLPFKDEVFEASTISLALRNVSDAQKTISEMSRVTVSRGLVASLDFARPLHNIQRFLYYPYILAFFPLIGRLVSKAWYDTFRYLGPSILRARTGRQVVNIMKQEGVLDARSVPLTGGIVCLVYGRKR